MIDTREYETTEDLEAAMANEANIAKSDWIKNEIKRIELTIERYKHVLEMLNREYLVCQNAIDTYWRKVNESGKQYTRKEYDQSEWYAS